MTLRIISNNIAIDHSVAVFVVATPWQQKGQRGTFRSQGKQGLNNDITALEKNTYLGLRVALMNLSNMV